MPNYCQNDVTSRCPCNFTNAVLSLFFLHDIRRGMHPQNSCDLAIATVANSTRDHRSCRTFKPLRIDLDVFAYRLISSCSKSTTTVFSAVRCENSFLAVFLVPSGHALESAEANGSASNPRCSHAAAPCVTLQAVRPPLETHYSSACGCSFSLCYSIISAMPSTCLFVFFVFILVFRPVFWHDNGGLRERV